LNRGRLLVAVSCQPSVSLRPAQLAVEQSKLEEIAMANQMTDIDEGSKGGRRSVLIVGIVAACLFAFLIFFGYGGGSKSEAPATPQPTTEAPANTEAPAKPEAPAQ
jgi:hypothetical protein